jgi:hypothetical protein
MKMYGGRDHTNIPKTLRKDNRKKSSARKVDKTMERIKIGAWRLKRAPKRLLSFYSLSFWKFRNLLGFVWFSFCSPSLYSLSSRC